MDRPADTITDNTLEVSKPKIDLMVRIHCTIFSVSQFCCMFSCFTFSSSESKQKISVDDDDTRGAPMVKLSSNNETRVSLDHIVF